MSSNINPNNIDGTYPVAGQDNNSQGFRDNFTNTKTNFQYASDEITDLQNNAILKAALAGTTLDNNMLGSLVYNGVIADFAATRVALGSVSGSQAINYALGHYQTLTTSGPVSLSFTNFPPSGNAGFIRVQVTVSNVAHTLTLPSAVSLGTTGIQGWSANVITFAAIGTYEFGFVTSNGGSTVTIFDLNRPLSYYTNPVSIAASTASGNVTTGALVVTGGVGIGGNLNVSGSLGITSFSASGNVTGGNLLTGGFASVAGNVRAGNGFYSTSTYTGAYTDGIVVDYVTGNGRISVGGSDGLNIYNGGVGSSLIVNIGTGGQVTATGAIKSNSVSGGVGYSTGAGNTVAQSGTRATGVTINAPTGAITLVSAAGNASYTTFTVTNSAVAATDVIIVNQKSGADKYEVYVSNVATGSFAITVSDATGTTTEAPVINFAVIKGVTA